MKRIMVFWLVLLLPIFTFAKEYEDKDINMKIEIDEEYIVLTRNNLDNNPGLEKLNLSKDYIFNLMMTNNIYFDIVKSDLSYEILVVVPKTKAMFDDIRTINDEELSLLKTIIVNETKDTVPTVYKNNYPFIVVDYKDEKNGYNLINYYTLINSHGYNIQLQKKTNITKDDEYDLMEIVDGIEFNEVEKKEEEVTKKPFDYKIIIYGVIIGLIAGIITYVIGTKVIMKKKK